MSRTKKAWTKEELISENFEVLVNGEDTKDWELGRIPEDDAKIEVFHTSKHLGRKEIHLSDNIKVHDKGIKKICMYKQFGFTPKNSRKSVPVPYHRFLYAWFYGKASEGLEIMHKNNIGTDNRVSNLIEGTHKDNLAMREGAINQYGKRLKDRV